MRKIILMAILVAGCQQVDPTTREEGRQYFVENCTQCHGDDARGHGEMAQHLLAPVPDLTRLGAHHGGTFPRDYVMSVIDGYRRGDHFSAAMPEFGETDLGEIEITDDGAGHGTPIPRKLLSVADYLESIQRR